MSRLANLKIRTKLLVALLPLVIMVIASAVYGSIAMIRADNQYSNLIGKSEKGLRSLTETRVRVNRFWQGLYKEIAQTDVDTKQLTEAELDRAAVEYNALSQKALRESPHLTQPIEGALAVFNQAVSDAHAVRTAALANDDQKAMQLMRGSVDAALERARVATVDVIEQGAKLVDKQSDDLTAATHRSVLIRWLIIGFGLIPSFILALYLAQREIVNVLLSFRGQILAVAEGRLDQPIPDLDRTNEIGEMSRALSTLQQVARERRNARLGQGSGGSHQGSFAGGRGFCRVRQNFAVADVGIHRTAYTEPFTSRIRSHCALPALAALRSMHLGNRKNLLWVRDWWGRLLLSVVPLAVEATAGNQIHISAGIRDPYPSTSAFRACPRSRGGDGSDRAGARSAPLSQRQQALLEALVPTVAVSAEILAGNLETKRLLEHTQVQAATVAAAEERSRLILGSVGEGICGLDMEGLISFINPAGAKMLGYEPEELVRQPMHALVHYARPDGSEFPPEECSAYKTLMDGQSRVAVDEVLWRKRRH